MSSILDALNKLEHEKAQSRRDLEDTSADPVSAAHDLVGRSVLRDRMTVRVAPATLIVSAAAVLTIVVSVALIIAIALGRSGNGDETGTVADAPSAGLALTAAADPLANAPVPTQSAPFVRLSDPQPTPMPQQVQATPPALSPNTNPPAAAPESNAASAPAIAAPQTSNAAPASVQITPPATSAPAQTPPQSQTEPAPAPRLDVAEPPAQEPAAEAPRPTRVARSADDVAPRSSRSLPAADAPAKAARRDDLHLLPNMTDADVQRYGLVQLKINMASPAGPANPQGSAILTLREEAEDGSVITNTMKFYEGQRLQTTTLRIFKVERDGVGIEDMRSGDRYRLEF